ncbi:MAG TPA: type II secretion system protein GspD, partial [Clostridia bacterium]|nr:type II secretion system protein GspD [Clostridia bacterium]
MPLRPRLTTLTKAAATASLLLLLFVTACQHANTPPKTPPKPAEPEKTAKPVPEESYDKQIEEILSLARREKWEQAKASADVLYQQAPKNAQVERIHTWVTQSAQKVREKQLEDQIREIDSRNSVFNPTIPSLLFENKDRGLPASKDIRDTISRIENAPYIPESYGKTIYEKGPLFDLESTKGRMAKVLEKEISIHLDNVTLENIIINLGQTAGINIVADKAVPALKQALSANLEKVKLGEFLRYIGRNYDLQFQVGDELVWVVDAKDPKRLMEETRFYRLRKGFILPAEFGAEDATRQTITVNNVTTRTETQKFNKFVNDQAPEVTALEKAIKELYTGSKFFIDYERNLVVARGTEEQLAVMEQIIEEFDRPIQQVLIEARFITVSKPAFLQLGVLWETDRPMGTNAINRRPRDNTGLNSSESIPNLGIGIQETFTNILNRESLTATITALEQSGESQTLSAPRLTVLNNRPATISDGKVQYYYEEYQVKTIAQQYYTASSFVPSGKPTKITSGAELKVLASISGDGNSILLALNPIVNTDVQLVRFATLTDYNDQGDVVNAFDINLPQYRTQELATRVSVKSGETVVMGGVLERQRSTFVESVPVLGSIPIIGALFRRRT